MNNCDYSRSFLQFSTEHSRHTPRLRIKAGCALTGPDGVTNDFYLAGTCMAENMYRASGLVQEPTATFTMVAAHNDQLVMRKQHASAGDDVVNVIKLGGTLSTRDGKGATVTKIDICVRRLPKMRKIESYADIRDAILGNKVINGRTTYRETAKGTTVVLDYPVDVCNIPHDHEGWQVDTGPIVMPDPDLSGSLPVARLNLDFIVYNSWTYAEAALRSNAPVKGGGQTLHYSKLISMDNVVNELFCEY